MKTAIKKTKKKKTKRKKIKATPPIANKKRAIRESEEKNLNKKFDNQNAKGSVETDPFLIAINGAYENTKF